MTASYLQIVRDCRHSVQTKKEYGSVIDWIYSVAGGIRPASSGFERAVIAPIPSKKIECVEVEYNRVHGKIVSKWTNTDGGVRYEITTLVPMKIVIDEKEYDVDAG